MYNNYHYTFDLYIHLSDLSIEAIRLHQSQNLPARAVKSNLRATAGLPEFLL